jgi:hypothetical protein
MLLKVDGLYAQGSVHFVLGGLIFQPWPIKKRASLSNLPNILPPCAVNANRFLLDADDNVPMDDAWGDNLVTDTAVTAPLCDNKVDGAVAAPLCDDVADGAVAAPSCKDLTDSAVKRPLLERYTAD